MASRASLFRLCLLAAFVGTHHGGARYYFGKRVSLVYLGASTCVDFGLFFFVV